MVQNGDSINDGADERMLNTEEKENLARKDEVKFISGDQQNGDAKIDIGTLDKAFTGMTKEELMKYANDPFWVRLRWIFFIIFWAIWAAMLVGAILIIVNAPKCAAPTPLVWWKQGPLVKFDSNEANPNDVEIAKKINARGVIYELPAEETYSTKQAETETKIKKLVETYKDTGINIILDITANYVTQNSSLLEEALKDENKQNAFIWIKSAEVPNNWRSIVNGSAWDDKISPDHFVLNQFGPGKYDLYMNETNVKNLLKENLIHLIQLGIKGFRLANAKYFIINKKLQDEVISDDLNYIHDQYGFWTHSQTTFQEGLGDLLHEFTLAVKNASNGDAFLSVSEDTIRPEVFKTKSIEFGIDIPIYGRFTHSLGLQSNATKKNLYDELKRIMDVVGNSTWLQWVYDTDNLGPIHPSAYNMFLILLPGVPIINSESMILTANSTTALLKNLENLRLTPTYMHGNFDLYHSGDIVAYSRFKSGNPGFFVVFNPTETYVNANFTRVGLPDKMTFDLFSENYNSTDAVLKGKVMTHSIPLSPYSAAVLTYVPVK